MTSLRNSLINWWHKPDSPRRVVLATLALVLLVLAVFFSNDIQNLFNRSASQAAISEEDLGRIWEAHRPDGGESVAHNKLTIVERQVAGETKRWLYVAGGMRVAENVVEGRYQAFVSKEVRRLELDQTNNAIVGAAWETVPDMNFGHMEFGFVQAGDYLYVVAGDMHQPPTIANATPLLYSTIERINLANPTSWEVYSLLSGVNYYPEVAVEGANIHVVGGVYGNPFPAPPMPDAEGVATPIDPGQFMQDLLNSGEPETKWQTLGLVAKKVIGPALYLPKGSLNTPVVSGSSTGGGSDPGQSEGDGGTTGGTSGGTGQTGSGSVNSDSDVQIQQASHTIRLIQPNGGETKFVGRPTLIKWEVTPAGFNPYTAVNVWWEVEQNQWEYLGQQSRVLGEQFEWTPSHISFNSRIRVCLVGGENNDGDPCPTLSPTSDDSDSTFEVRQPNSIFVNNPPDGSTITGGVSYNVTWIGGDSYVRLEYSLDGWRWYYVGQAPAPAGTFAWTVPDIAATGVRLRVTDIISGASDTQTFTIAGGAFVSTKLTEGLLSGNFVTTVGEHFIVSTTNVNNSTVKELGSDYTGSPLSTTWQKGRVSSWGHLRFLVTDETNPQVVPVPQGRYGHRLIQYGSGLHVFGGASWSNEVVVGDEAFRTFWVIDDSKHPVYRYSDPLFSFRFNAPVYEFVGNISYRYNATRGEWEGTNRVEGPNTRNKSLTQLDGRFAFNSDFTETVGRGRAFYSLARLENSDLLAVGGLINNIPAGTHESLQRNIFPCGSGVPCQLDIFRTTVRPTSSTRQLTSASGWTKEQAYFEDVYNLFGHGIQGGAIVYAGQNQFNYPVSDAKATLHNPHVPDYNFQPSVKTSAFSSQTDVTSQRWLPMADLTSNIPASQRRLAYIEIDPPVFTMLSGSSRTFTASAFDQNGDPLNTNLTYSWQLENNSDSSLTLVGAGRTAALTAGSLEQTFRVRVTANYSPAGSSPQLVSEHATISVRDNLPDSELALVRIKPQSIQTVINGKRQFEANTFDQFGSQIGLGGGFIWSADPAAGTILSQNGRTAIFQAAGSVNGDTTISAGVTVRVNNQFADSATVTIKETALGQSAVFGGDVLATTARGEFSPVSTIFHYGGFHADSGEFSNVLLSLGYFGELGGGRPQVSITLTPDRIAPDDATFSLATIKVTDQLGNPITRMDNGDRLAVNLVTSRSASGLVTNDGTYFGANPERAEILGESVPDPFAGGQYAFIDDDSNSDGNPLTGPGEAKFRIYAKTASDPQAGISVTVPGITVVGQEPLSMVDTGASATLLIGNFPGVPVASQSRITAIPSQVPADDTTTSTVVVELRDYLGNPVSDYFVRLLSDRNLGGSNTDTISPTEDITEVGLASFTVRSGIKGLSTLRIAVAENLADLGQDPTMPNFTRVRFTGSISSLVPASAKQGQGPFGLTATGQSTGWNGQAPNQTTVRFVAPTTTTFISGVSNQPLTNDDVILPADGFGLHQLGLSAPEFAGRSVTFSVKSGSGAIFGQSTAVLNTDGRAFFTYEAGSTAGMVKLEARIQDGPASELWIMLTDPRPHPYELNLFASPTSLSSGTSQLRVGVYRYTSQGKRLQDGQEGQDDATVAMTYFTDDQPSGGSISTVTNPTDSGLGTATYSSGSRSGPVRVFVTGTYRGYSIATATTIDKLSAADAGISFNAAGITISGSATQTMTVPGVSVATTAPVGIWRFKTETPTPEGDTEVITHPFTVVPANAVTGPRITAVSPAEVDRGSTNTEITITGADTNFFGLDSVVTLTPTGSGANAGAIEITNTTVLSPTSIRIRVAVAENAYAGFWNVRVDTDNGAAGIEVAEMAGETDLLVTTGSNYIVDLIASPHRIPRDGQAQSQITAFVGRLDPVSGQISPIADQAITFGFVGADGGALAPASATTSAAGIASTTYTTDAGTENEEVYIRGTVNIQGSIATGVTFIIKEVDSSHRFGLAATPTLLPMAGGTSALEANVYDRAGVPVAANTPVGFLVAGPGSVNPVTNPTNSAGRATSQFQIGQQLSPKVSRVVAKATIPGLGTVFSNDALITTGAQDSDYLVTISANPTTLEAGSSDASVITATLTYTGSGNPAPVANWPIRFSLSLDQPGDYLTIFDATTNAQGQATTRLIAGSYYPGPVVVTAQAIGLTAGQVVVTKTADQTINPQLSTLSAVPKYVPADGSAFSVLTVTARNRNFVPLAGKTVSISSTLGVITPGLTGVTNALGQATFQIRSNTVGTGNVTAVLEGVNLTTRVFFEPVGSLLPVQLDTIVPLEAKSYDRHVKLYLRHTTGSADPVIDELYYTNATDQVIGLPTIYLTTTTNYTYWAKGKFHLARTKPVTTTSAGTLAVNFSGLHRGQTKGLLIGDLAPDRAGDLANPFKDNAINAVDVVVIIGSWFRYAYPADFNSDYAVNSVDFTYWSINYGAGAPLP